MSMLYKKKLRNYINSGCKVQENEALRQTTPTSHITEDGAGVKEIRNDVVDRKLYVLVQSTMFKVPPTFFAEMSKDIRDSIKHTSGHGATSKNPIIMNSVSVDQFKQILIAHNALPSLDVDSLTLDHLLTIGELSLRYQLGHLRQWFIPAFESAVSSHSTPFRSATNVVYVRALKLAMSYGHMALVNSLQTKWMTRMLWGELFPRTALIFADTYGLQKLLAHACFLYLLHVEPRIVNGQLIDEQSSLNPRQILYIRSGYYALTTYWKQIARTPLTFEQSPGCQFHSQCHGAWRMRWSVEAERPCSLSELDVFGRLKLMEQTLSKDSVIKMCMFPDCRKLALKAIPTKREKISHDLHHLFDLW